MFLLKPAHYMGIWAFHSASSVIGAPLRSVYPELGPTHIRKYMNRIMEPRVDMHTRDETGKEECMNVA